MTGLEKIIDDIQKESNQTVNEILAKAKEEARQIRQDAEKKSKQDCEQMEKEAARQNADLLSRSEFAASLRQKQRVLAARQEMIADIMKKALTEAENLPDDQYFQTILRMTAKAAHQESGEIVLNEKDRRRLPADFLDELQKKLPQGAKLSVAEQTAEIRSGFILKYGDIEENCSFDAVLAARHDELQDKVRAVLFES